MELYEQMTRSVFPVSIGTSLALESLFDWYGDNRWSTPYDSDREIPNRISLSDYDVHMVHVDTLFRNMFNALPKIGIKKIKEDSFIEMLNIEIEMLQDIYKFYGVLDKLELFTFSYKTFYNKLSKDRLRIPTTDKQKEYDYIEQTSISNLSVELVTYDSKITTKHSKVLITTHHPFVLLSYKIVNKIDALESHTGKLIISTDFNKYYHPIGKKPLLQMPFKEKLFYILGDRKTIKPMNISVRKELVEFGKKYWTPVTTDTKIKEDIQDYASKDIKTIFNILPTII